MRMRIELPFVGPMDWDALLEFFQARAIENVERCESGAYVRATGLEAPSGIVTVQQRPDHQAVTVICSNVDPGFEALIAARVRRMFDTDADIAAIETALGSNPHLRDVCSRMPGMRVAGAWDSFELIVRAVLGQQVTVSAARTLASRLCNRFGASLTAAAIPNRLFPAPEYLVDADVATIGMPRKRAETIRGLAQAVVEKRVDLDSDPDSLERQLLELPGIGKWTVAYVRMRACKDPDAFPVGDIALLRAAQRLGIAADFKALEKAAGAWRPWRAYATVRLWRSLRPH